MKKLLVCLLFSLALHAQSFEKKTYTDAAGHVLPYQILMPANYNPSVKYPVVLVLHGAGERGDDNMAQMKYGAPVFLNAENREKYPAIVIFPQCPKDSYWSSVTIDRTTKPTTFLFNYTSEANWPLQSTNSLAHTMASARTLRHRHLASRVPVGQFSPGMSWERS